MQLPGLWQTVAGSHSNPRQAIDNFFHCCLVRKIKHNRGCDEKKKYDLGNRRKANRQLQKLISKAYHNSFVKVINLHGISAFCTFVSRKKTLNFNIFNQMNAF